MAEKDVNLKSPLYVSGKSVGNPAGPKGGKTVEDPLGYKKGK
jgi:hypothetical protein